MKKLILVLIIAASIGISVPGVEASPAEANGAASSANLQVRQILRHITRRHRRWNNRNNGNNRVRYETRIVYKGNKTFRDTYRITYKNGREQVKRVSRVRIY